jgi:hypothetical protein
MKRLVYMTAAMLALTSGVALATDPLANNTSTSAGAPASSPNYAAPRSSAVPGLPAQAIQAQTANQGHFRAALIAKGKIPQAPTSPLTGHVVTAPD